LKILHQSVLMGWA